MGVLYYDTYKNDSAIKKLELAYVNTEKYIHMSENTGSSHKRGQWG